MKKHIFRVLAVFFCFAAVKLLHCKPLIWRHSTFLSLQIKPRTKSRAAYIALTLFFGLPGVYNFYAGFGGRSVVQLLITLFFGWLGIGVFITGLRVLIEIFVVNTDVRVVRFN